MHNAREVLELTSALASVVDASATIDADGLWVAVNPAFEALLVRSADEVLRTPLLDLVHELDRPSVAPALLATAAQRLEVRFTRNDGTSVPVELSLAPREGKSGHYCFLRDLTKQKLVEGRLALAASITAVGCLATDLAHEINNPLAVILANVEEAIRVASDLERFVPADSKADLVDLRTMLVEAHAASQRVQFVVRDLRVFTCADDRVGRIDINAVIEASCNIAFAEVRHRARLVKDLNASPPVVGSETKLAHVFFNLLVNAAQAMPAGSAEKSEIVVTTRPRDPSSVVVTFSDTGSGIPAADAERVFEPFFTTRPRRPGMGLTICRASVLAHGGTLSIHPREGGGTVVTVVLPTAEGPDPRSTG